MAETPGAAEFPRLRAPRAAAAAGVVFGALFATSIVLLHTAPPGGVGTSRTESPDVVSRAECGAAPDDERAGPRGAAMLLLLVLAWLLRNFPAAGVPVPQDGKAGPMGAVVIPTTP